MNDITKRLRHFVEVYHTVETVNELGEKWKDSWTIKKSSLWDSPFKFYS